MNPYSEMQKDISTIYTEFNKKNLQSFRLFPGIRTIISNVSRDNFTTSSIAVVFLPWQP